MQTLKTTSLKVKQHGDAKEIQQLLWSTAWGKKKAILHREWTVDPCSHWEQKEINYQLLIMLLGVFFQESDYSSEEQNTFGIGNS